MSEVCLFINYHCHHYHHRQYHHHQNQSPSIIIIIIIIIAITTKYLFTFLMAFTKCHGCYKNSEQHFCPQSYA